MTCASRSITTNLSSASADSECCWTSRDQRITTGQCRCANRFYRSWTGLTSCTFKILAVAVGGWLLTCPRRDPDQWRPCPKPHPAHGFTCDLPETPYHGSRLSIRASSLPVGSKRYHGIGSGVGHRHHLHPAAESLHVPGGDHGSPP
jgi:hypothetical protein